MSARFSYAILAVCVLCCVPHSAETPPAANVPVHVLTLEQAGSLTEAEQGDLIEIRLEPAAWRLTRQSGEARLEPYGNATADAFRYRATSVGNLELTFADGQRTATYRFFVR